MVKRKTRYVTRTGRPIYSENGDFYFSQNNGVSWRRLPNTAPVHTWSWIPNNGNYTNVNINNAGYVSNLKRNNKVAKIQSLWRGYKARQNIRHPRPNNSKALAKMTFMEKRNNKSGRRYNARTHRSRTGLENIRRIFN